MRLFVFLVAILACFGIPLLFRALGSPPSTDPPPMEEGSGGAELENPGSHEALDRALRHGEEVDER